MNLGPEVCVRITTGTVGENHGTLTLKMGTAVAATGNFTKGAVVIDSCFNDLQDITLSNPSNDAWAGEISITENGKPTSLSCQGCIGQYLSDVIVVDGDADSTDQASTQCLNGEECTISWVVTGK